MRHLFLFLAVIVTACGGSFHFDKDANNGRDDMVQLGDGSSMVGKTQKDPITVPVYYTWNVSGKSWMDQAYNPGAFGLADHKDIVDAAVLQGIIPTKLVEYDPEEASRDDYFILLIFSEEKLAERKLPVLIVWKKVGTTPFEIRLKKNVSTINKYCYFWWDVRTVIGDNFIKSETTRVINYYPNYNDKGGVR